VFFLCVCLRILLCQVFKATSDSFTDSRYVSPKWNLCTWRFAERDCFHLSEQWRNLYLSLVKGEDILVFQVWLVGFLEVGLIKLTHYITTARKNRAGRCILGNWLCVCMSALSLSHRHFLQLISVFFLVAADHSRKFVQNCVAALMTCVFVRARRKQCWYDVFEFV